VTGGEGRESIWEGMGQDGRKGEGREGKGEWDAGPAGARGPALAKDGPDDTDHNAMLLLVTG